VKILALAARATRDTLDCVSHSLSLDDPKIIGLPPNRPNIKYVVERPTSIAEFAKKITDELLSKRIDMPKTVVLCHTLQNCYLFQLCKENNGQEYY